MMLIQEMKICQISFVGLLLTNNTDDCQSYFENIVLLLKDLEVIMNIQLVLHDIETFFFLLMVEVRYIQVSACLKIQEIQWMLYLPCHLCQSVWHSYSC